MGRLDRLLSLGQADASGSPQARHVRVTNALALLGVVLALTGVPIDAISEGLPLVMLDLVTAAGFAACPWLNARGRRTAARVVLIATSNVAMLGSVAGTGAVAELRTVCFPLVLMPFLVFGAGEMRWAIPFALLPAVAYFALGATAHAPPPGLTADIYAIYAPVMSLAMIAAGAVVFVHVERAAEAKVRAAQARAAEGARLVALGEMASGIAHEIRNPLAAIHLAAGQIVARPTDAALAATLGERIQRIVMRASRIIDALRSVARDGSADPFVATPIERVIADTLELCGKRFADHGIALAVPEVPRDLVVECRPVQLAQVLVNLLGNAYDAVAGAPERWVRLEVTADAAWLEIAVVDSGPGVPAGAGLRVFEPFFTTKAPDRGTGIGLSLSRDLAVAHGGTLELDASAPHTRFVLRIPRQRCAQ